MEPERQKWHVAIESYPGGTLTTKGLFDSEEAGWAYVRTLPVDQQQRARVMKWNRPEDHDPPA